MRKIGLILALVGAALAAAGQALPSGSVLFGQNTWLAPDGSVWTGKSMYGYKKLLGPDDLLTKVDTSSAGYGLSWDNDNRQLNWGQIRTIQTEDQTVNILEVDMDGIGADGWQLGKLNITGPNPGIATIAGNLGERDPQIHIQAVGLNSGSLPSIFTGTNVYMGRDGVYITGQSAQGGSLFVGSSQTPGSDTANIIVQDLNGIGIVYDGDYESTFQDRSLVTKKYVDSLVTGGGAEGSLSLIDEITWTEFSTPNGPVHPLSVGYYVLTVSSAEEVSSGVKQGTYTMVVYDRQVGGSAVGAGTVFLQHQSQAWCYNVYQDYGGNIRIEPLNSATTFRMFGGGMMASGSESIMWSVPLTGDPRYGNILTRNGDRVEIEYAGSFPFSEDKTLRLRIGPTASPDQVFSHTIPDASATDWTLRVVVTRSDASTLDVEAYMQWGTSVEEMYQLQGFAEDTPFQVIQLTGQSNNGIILRNGRATYYPYLGPIDTAPL